MKNPCGRRRPRAHDDPELFIAVTTFIGYGIMVLFGHIKDFYDWICGRRGGATNNGYAVLLSDWENFYTRRLFCRVLDVFNRPIASAPGRQFDLIDREQVEGGWDMALSESTRTCLNFGSYNYLGFGDPVESEIVVDSMYRFSAATCSTRAELGTTRVHRDLEDLVARFVGKPASLVFAMGFATNSTVIPALVGAGDLIVSDANNHSSIISGCRASGAKIKVFAHNDANNLDAVLRHAIITGDQKTKQPWGKILVIVEGVYSMEGEICPLADIVRVAKSHKAYVYLDEAHSIGAVGETGRGVCEHHGVNTADVDIMMGTFTKSFGSVGGYIAGSRGLIEYLRSRSIGAVYGSSLSPPCAAQVIYSMSVIMGEAGLPGEGAAKINQLHANSNMFRDGLLERGFDVLGDTASPVVPLMLYNPSKLPTFSRECLKRGLAVVVVGYPATPITLCRARFCLSASHTEADIQKTLDIIDELGDMMLLKYQHVTGVTMALYSSRLFFVAFGVAAAITAMILNVQVLLSGSVA